MNALGLGIISVLAVMILFGSRRWALLGMVAGVLYLTLNQYITVAGFFLYPVRVLVLAAAARIALRGEFRTIKPSLIDTVLVVLYLYTLSVFLPQADEGQVFQIGAAVDAILLYFSFRSLVTSFEDVQWLLRGIAWLLVPYTALVLIESHTFQSFFNLLGGVDLMRAGDLWVREGRLRAAGSFGHPSLLGTFGGVFLPLFVAMWFVRGQRPWAIVGALLCLAIVYASNSGGPVLCAAIAVLGWAMWPLRHSMQWVRYGLVAFLVLLALVMKAPIWYVLARLSAVTGGDGHHRAVLMDIAFQNLDRWWFGGMPLRETAGWLPYTNLFTGHIDVTNNYLQFGLTAGMGALLLLIAVLVAAYKQLGRAMASVRAKQFGEAGGSEQVLWGLGVVLLVHIVNWFGITYWDQTNAIWFLQLAFIASLAAEVQSPEARSSPVPPAPQDGEALHLVHE